MDFFIITIIRLVVPLIIFRFPLLGIFLVAYIDGEDWHWLNLSGQEEIEFYRIWDKLLDVYYLGIAFLTSISWTDKIARLISFYSYTLRILGVLIFIVLRQSFLLFLFPNFFEVFFIFYLVYTNISKQKLLFFNTTEVFAVILALFIPKLIVEYLFHVKGISPINELANLGELLGY